MPKVKLSPQDVDNIRWLASQRLISYSEIARFFGIHPSTVSLIVRGKRR